jgi:hypothetical protein
MGVTVNAPHLVKLLLSFAREKASEAAWNGRLDDEVSIVQGHALLCPVPPELRGGDWAIVRVRVPFLIVLIVVSPEPHLFVKLVCKNHAR